MTAITTPNGYDSADDPSRPDYEPPVRREVEVDTQLAELWSQINENRARLESNRISLAHKLRIRAEYHGRSRTPYYPAWAELEALAQDKLRSGDLAEWDAREYRRTLGTHDTLIAKSEALHTAAEPLEAEYNAAPWSRFFLVNNTGGHIHSSLSCSTCHITTSFSWLPELSGLSEKDAVDAHGAILCTVCFPSAPVEWTNQHELEALERTAAKAKTQCPSSGTWDHDSSGLQYASPRAKCNRCQQTVSVTSTGKLRGHKLPEAN